MYKKILLLLIACGTLITIDAQEHTMELTLGQTIERARRQSPDAQTAQHSFRSAYWNYKYYGQLFARLEINFRSVSESCHQQNYNERW